MIDLGIKCFMVGGECILPVSATIVYNMPSVVLALILVSYGSYKHKSEGEGND